MQFIPFSELSYKIKISTINFISKYEPFCVQLISFLRHSYKNIYVVFINDISIKDIYGIITLNTTILHCLPFANTDSNSALQNDFIDSFTTFFKYECTHINITNAQNNQSFPSCINGLSGGTSLLIKSFEKINKFPSQINEYALLKLNIKDFLKLKPFPFENKECLIRCKKDIPQKYFSSLFELQKNYELEEVLPQNTPFNEDSCRLRLKKLLRTQYILALELENNELVSKAGTNAIGIKCVQIGGVYTNQNFRHKNYSYNTIYALLRKLCLLKKQPILFVKKQNKPAYSLYEKLKFQKINDYSIVYY